MPRRCWRRCWSYRVFLQCWDPSGSAFSRSPGRSSATSAFSTSGWDARCRALWPSGSGRRREAGLAQLSASTVTLSGLLGVVAGLVLYACAGWLCNRVLDLPPDIAREAVPAVQILAACLPLVTLTAALRGMLEGARRFGWINAIRAPLGILTFAAPLGVAHATVSLWALCATLFALRVLALVAHWWVCASLLPAFGKLAMPTREAALELFGFGAWVTVSNLVGSIMVYVDRFIIGAQVSIAAVAYYTAPYEVLTRLG